MRSSKKYQEIADILNTICKKEKFVEEPQNGPNCDKNILFLLIVGEFEYQFQQSNPRFKPEYFRYEVFKD